MAAINNCTAIMTDPHGRYRLTPHDTLAAFRNLTLYTNAESCPMVCTSRGSIIRRILVRWDVLVQRMGGVMFLRLVI